MGKMYSKASRLKKQGGGTILIFDKIYFKPQLITRGRERYYTFIKVKIYQEEIAILNIYAPNTRVSKFIKERKL